MCEGSSHGLQQQLTCIQQMLSPDAINARCLDPTLPFQGPSSLCCAYGVMQVFEGTPQVVLCVGLHDGGGCDACRGCRGQQAAERLVTCAGGDAGGGIFTLSVLAPEFARVLSSRALRSGTSPRLGVSCAEVLCKQVVVSCGDGAQTQDGRLCAAPGVLANTQRRSRAWAHAVYA